MTTVLAIDTAAPRLQLALLGNDGRVDVSIDDVATGHAELIFDRIAALLARNGVSYASLDRVAATNGPGSFTGLRIGLSAARGIGLARSIPVLGIPSLLGIALGEPAGVPRTVIVDARRNEAYVQDFDGDNQPLSAARLLPLGMAEASLPAGTKILAGPFGDIAAIARYAVDAEPATYVPEALYVRDADAKPQTAARIARRP